MRTPIIAATLFFTYIAVKSEVPNLVSYQGRVASAAGVNFDGSGKFKFALVNAAGTTTYWSNDGTSSAGSEPTAAVTLTVARGLYSLLLGDASLANMTAIPAGAFAHADVRLRVWFDDGTNGSQQLTPDQRLAPTGYLSDGAVTAAKIATGAITTQHLDSNITLSGVTTGTFSGNVTGNATNFTGTLAGDVTGSQGATTIAASVVTGKAIAGFVSGAGTVTASDSVLTAINKLNGNVALRAPLASPSFTGTLGLPTTTGASAGVITQNGSRLMHSYGSGNFFAGTSSGNFTLTGTNNTAVGALSMTALTTGMDNTGVGLFALAGTTTGNGNTAVGRQALYTNTTGSDDTAVGKGALLANTTGSANSAFGVGALSQNTTGHTNTAVGKSALLVNVDGIYNTAAGAQALQDNTSGSTNCAFGLQSLLRNTTGGDNVGFGTQALSSNTTANANTAVGVAALFANTAAGSTAMGYHALFANTSGGFNTAVGYSAMGENTTGESNTSTGYLAIYSNLTGSRNTASGHLALYSNVSGENNTAMGHNALAANTTSNNTAIGKSAMESNTTGGANTAVGFNALKSNQTSGSNTAVGTAALANCTGANNTAVGQGAGFSLTSGNDNICINNSGEAGDLKTIRIGASAHNKTFIAGIRGITTGSASGVNVLVDSNGQLGTVSSSRRYKEDIHGMGMASDRLAQLRPVTFRYKKPYANGDKPIQFGLIAEEVAEVFPELAVYNEAGQPETVKYHDLIPMLLNEQQKLKAQKDKEVAGLEARNEELKARLAAVEAREHALAARLAKIERLLSDEQATTAKVTLTRGNSKP